VRAEGFERGATLPEGVRLRSNRVIRDYGMFDRREAPQYFAGVHPDRGNATALSPRRENVVGTQVER
jgi:hypothetical protein